MKKIALISMAVLALLLTQCKKKDITPAQIISEKVHITFYANGGGEKTVFHEDTGLYTWSGTEYLYVGGSAHGYMGTLVNNGSGGSSFSGVITQPNKGEYLHFIYLGKGSEKSFTDGTSSTTMDFSNQSTGTKDAVTTYHIAMYTVVYESGNEFSGGTMEAKISIARLNLSEFEAAGGNVYMHGDAIYNTGTINFKTGNVIGTKGDINIGNGSDKYIAMIPQTSPSRAEIKFDNDKNSGQLVFLRGVQGNKYYCKSSDTTALPIATSTLPTNPLTSAFSVASGKQVKFSPGNLRYNDKTKHWSFAAHQYDYLGSWSATGYQDLFCWGQNGKNSTDMTSYKSYKYGDANLTISNGGDWGSVVSIGENNWRTLTKGEMNYLLLERKTTTNVRFAKAQIYRGENDTINGLIILPDDWQTSYYSLQQTNTRSATYQTNKISSTNWVTYLEANGAVFLPAAGLRSDASGNSSGTVVYNPNVYGRYWSSSVSTKDSKDYAHFLLINRKALVPYDNTYPAFRDKGMSVRLVCDK